MLRGKNFGSTEEMVAEIETYFGIILRKDNWKVRGVLNISFQTFNKNEFLSYKMSHVSTYL